VRRSPVALRASAEIAERPIALKRGVMVPSPRRPEAVISPVDAVGGDVYALAAA
jgi:hypothetical protein